MEYGVGVIQFSPVFGNCERNSETSSRLIGEAARLGANLVVLPELCNTGYLYESREHAYALGESLDDSHSIRAWTTAANRFDMYIVAGMNEQYCGKSYNSAVLVGPQGVIGVYRKLHLWDKEKRAFHPGDELPHVYELPFVRVSMQICYDLWFPELSRKQALMGAELICVPTNWSPTPDGAAYDQFGLFAGHHLMIAHSIANQLAFACADRIGEENELAFLGGSCILDRFGQVAGLCGAEQEEVVVTRFCNDSCERIFLQDRRGTLY